MKKRIHPKLVKPMTVHDTTPLVAKAIEIPAGAPPEAYGVKGRPKTCWTTGEKFIACPKYNKTIDVYLPFKIDYFIRCITDMIKTDEWLGYLLGFKVEADGDTYYEVEEIRIPKQEVTGGSVDNITPIPIEEVPEGLMVIGTVHLHPFGSGPSFLSGTDEEYIGGNHDVTIVTSPTYDYTCKIRKNLPCGDKVWAPGKVIIDEPPIEGVPELLAIAKANIQKHVFTPQPQPHFHGDTLNAYQPQGGYWENGFWHSYQPYKAPEGTPVTETFTEKTDTTITKATSDDGPAEILNMTDYLKKVDEVKKQLDQIHGGKPVEYQQCDCCRESTAKHRLQPVGHTQELFCPECWVDLRTLTPGV